jgi:hypothetical protein
MKIVNFLKKAVLASLTAGSTIVLAACYGPSYRGQHRPRKQRGDLRMRVIFNNQGVKNIKTCSGTNKETAKTYNCKYSTTQGYVDLNYYGKNTWVCAKDVDGLTNGEFLEKCERLIDINHRNNSYQIELEHK